jgi:hypothetical protein
LGRARTRGGRAVAFGRDEYRREYFASRREYHAYRNIVWSAGERVLEQQTGELGMLRDRGVERHPRWVVSILRRFDRVGVIQRTVPADSFNFAIGPVAARHIDMFRPEQERLHEDYREQVDERIFRIMVSRLVRLQGGRAAMTQELLLDLESRACAMDNRPMAGSEHQMAPKTWNFGNILFYNLKKHTQIVYGNLIILIPFGSFSILTFMGSRRWGPPYPTDGPLDLNDSDISSNCSEGLSSESAPAEPA